MPLDGETVPAATAAAAASLGISYEPLEAGSPGKVLSLSHLVAQHAAPTGPTKGKWSAKRWKARGFDDADF